MTAETVPQNQAAPADVAKTNTADNNLVQMRRLLENERAEKERAIAENRRLEQERERFTRGNKNEEEDEESSEPYIDQKTLTKKLSKLESRFESIVEKKAEEKARSMIEAEKMQSYLKSNSDFDQIMQPDMIQKFAEKCPGMAEAILRMPDGFDRQRLVYEAIKNTGVHKKEEPSKIQNTIDANRKSPYYSPSSGGNTPYAAVGDFSPGGQKNAYNKMQELKNKLRLG